MKSVEVISFDIGNTLVRLGSGGFCVEFGAKTGLPMEVLRPLAYEYFLTKRWSLEEAVYEVCRVIDFKNPQKLIDEFRPAPGFLFEHTVPAMERLLADGVPMVGISNCSPWEADGMEGLGLNRYLREIFYSYAIGAAKPDPAIFLHVQKVVGVSPENILHVGDSRIADVEGAMAVGWQAVLLDRDGKSIEREGTSSGIRVIRSLRELRGLL